MKGKSKRQKKIKNIFKRLKRQWKKQITIWKKERDDNYESRKSVENYIAGSIGTIRICNHKRRRKVVRRQVRKDEKIFNVKGVFGNKKY